MNQIPPAIWGICLGVLPSALIPHVSVLTENQPCEMCVYHTEEQ